MGLTMREKRALTNEIAVRYRKESKRGKQAMLDEFCRTTGYHRKYAVHLLGRWGKTEIILIDQKPVEFVFGTPRKRKTSRRPRVYDEPVHQALRRIWEFFDYQCGKRLVALMRANKNDNCFVEQKNDIAVRQTVGYYRFNTDAEYQALQEVYTHLCPLLNYFYASAKLIRKIRDGARVKKVYEVPTPPYRRLIVSTDVPDEIKKELSKRAGKLHIVKQKRLVDQAIAHLLRVHQDKSAEEHQFPGSSTSNLGKIS